MCNRVDAMGEQVLGMYSSSSITTIISLHLPSTLHPLSTLPHPFTHHPPIIGPLLLTDKGQIFINNL